MKTLIAVTTLALALLAGPVPAASAQAIGMPGTATELTLRPGDVLRITVWRNEEMSGEFAVLADGRLAHPVLGQVEIAGLPITEVEARLRSLLDRYESEPSFVMEPLLRVIVGGEVRQPSVYPLPPSTTLSEAVASAGGVTERGKLDNVRLQRSGEVVMLDLTDPSPGAMANTPIRSGDQLFVERRVSVFREYIAPAGSIVAALAAVASLLINNLN